MTTIRFLAVRIGVLAVFAVAAAIIFGGGVLAVVGILAGAALSLYRTWSHRRFLLRAAQATTPAKTAVMQALSVLLIMAVLLAGAALDLRLFIGLAAGMLLQIVVIMVNAFTEKLGLSHNNWGDK